MKKALEIRLPQRMPQVSRLRLVLGRAISRKCLRRSGEIKMVRRGVPFSRYEDGLKVKVDGCRSDGDGLGSGERDKEVLGAILLGTGGGAGVIDIFSGTLAGIAGGGEMRGSRSSFLGIGGNVSVMLKALCPGTVGYLYVVV